MLDASLPNPKGKYSSVLVRNIIPIGCVHVWQFWELKDKLDETFGLYLRNNSHASKLILTEAAGGCNNDNNRHLTV